MSRGGPKGLAGGEFEHRPQPIPPAGLPSALACWPEIARRLAGARPALFLDYDGTLSPIAPRPELATLPEPTRAALARLVGRLPVAVLSGRGREDVERLVGLPGVVYAGSHGFDIAGAGLRHEVGDGIPLVVERAAARLREELAGIEGALVEPKRFAVAAHYRLVPEERVAAVERAVALVLAEHPELRQTPAKKAFELRPRLDWDKGTALLWIVGALGVDGPDLLPLYVGDDATDEDAFRTVAARGGIGVLVAEEPRPTAATYSLREPEEVRELLERLAAAVETRPVPLTAPHEGS